jgi:hypothetical protein
MMSNSGLQIHYEGARILKGVIVTYSRYYTNIFLEITEENKLITAARSKA